MKSIRISPRVLRLGLLVLATGCPSTNEPMVEATTNGGTLDGPTTADETEGVATGTSGTSGVGGTMGSAGTVGTTDDASTATADGGSSETQAPPEHEVVYGALCAPCHGDAGEGVSVGPDIGPEIVHAHPEVAAYMVRNGDDNSTFNGMGELVGHPGEMPAFAPDIVTDEILDEIVTWLADMPQPATGQELFADYCSFCHGMTGGTNIDYVTAYHNLPFLQSGVTDTLPEFITYVRAGHVVDAMGIPVPPSERREWMPPFGPDVLTDEELTLIEAWARQQ